MKLKQLLILSFLVLSAVGCGDASQDVVNLVCPDPMTIHPTIANNEPIETGCGE